MDKTTTIESLKDLVRKFVEERDWQQYHTPKNLSMNIAGEAAELMEFFTWTDNEGSKRVLEEYRQDVEHEVADIAFALINFCMRNNIDLSQAIKTKMILNEQKYPVEKCKGKATKYHKL